MVIIIESLRKKPHYLEINQVDLKELIGDLSEILAEAIDHNGHRATFVTGAGTFNLQVLPE